MAAGRAAGTGAAEQAGAGKGVVAGPRVEMGAGVVMEAAAGLGTSIPKTHLLLRGWAAEQVTKWLLRHLLMVSCINRVHRVRLRVRGPACH